LLLIIRRRCCRKQIGVSLSKANLTNPLAQAIAAAAATASLINVLSLTKATITIDFAVSKDNSG
jgi:hypothetical protein